jgi:predicted transcriptional regulator
MKLVKKDVVKAIRSTSSLEEAATKLGVDRKTLYNYRVKTGLPVASR